MTRISNHRTQLLIVLTVFCLALSAFAPAVWAQTPDATEPPTEVPTSAPEPPPATEPPPPPVEVPTETEVPVEPVETTEPVPVETEVPTETTVPTEPVVPTEVVEPVETVTPTETVVPTESVEEEPEGTPDEESEPTPTPEIIVPDEMSLASDGAITVQPGESRDVVVRYTLGSDRQKTELTASLNVPDGQLATEWILTTVSRGDALEGNLKARVDVADATSKGDQVDTVWRVTAPAHIEQPATLTLSFSATIHRDDGVTDGAIANNLVTINAAASVHAPTLQCDQLAADAASNAWNCLFDTTHPDPIALDSSITAPAGWEISLNDMPLSEAATPLDAAVVTSGAFTLTADYPIGCPDTGAAESATLSLVFNYPSGEVITLTSDLAITFEKPTPALQVQSFEFSDVNMLESLTTTGHLTLAYSDAPCAWQATLELSDFSSTDYTIDDATMAIASVEGLPGATISMTDGTISIMAPESSQESASGEFTINLTIALPHEVPPGAYGVGVVTQIGWLEEL